MVRRSLILISVALLAGCATLDHGADLSAAKQSEAVAKVHIDLPNLSEACSAKVGRVKPSPTEPRVITLKRWETVAENRDRQADDCAAWWASYKTAMENTRTAH